MEDGDARNVRPRWYREVDTTNLCGSMRFYEDGDVRSERPCRCREVDITNLCESMEDAWRCS